jgi:hypothetical protein
MSLDGLRRRWYSTPGPVAQLVEQETFNLTVRGSSPRGLTEISSKFSYLQTYEKQAEASGRGLVTLW